MTAVSLAPQAVRPSREEFHELARSYSVIPVWRDLLADLITPVAAFARLCRDGEPGFLLESVEHGERWSRWSFVGRRPAATLIAADGQVRVEGGTLPEGIRTDSGILDALEDVLAVYRSPALTDLPPLHGGLMGYLGYDVVREVERLPDAPDDDQGFPAAILSIIGELAAFDHFRQRVTLISNAYVFGDPSTDDLDRIYDDAVDRLAQLAADGATPLDEPLVDPPVFDESLPDVKSSMGKDAYCRAVEVAKEHILAGDIFQVVVAQRFDFDLDADPFDFYRVLRQVNPSPYMYFVREPQVTLAGCSPEPMVQLLDGRVISRPIAGTRRRGRTDEEDRRLGAELSEHPKEIAEHVMLVDLARNDVGRVVTFGTETLDEMMTLERYSHVMHLTSQVSGSLAEGRTAIDVLRATLPAGTVSGAPKVRAMEIIDELEPTRRGPYAGVVGYLDFSGNIDTAIAIRTLVASPDGRASVQAGAGVVADSVPEHEDLECHNKARALLAAVPGARRMTAQRAKRGGPVAEVAGDELVAAPIERDVLLVDGPDAATFLQGQLSQDVEGMAEGESRWSFLLQPQGKVDAWLRVTRRSAESFALDVDGGNLDAVVSRLQRFLLRVKVELTSMRFGQGGLAVVGLRGPGASDAARTVGGEVLVAPVDLGGLHGIDVFATGVVEVPGTRVVDHGVLEALRIRAGVPAMGAELTEKTIPAEVGQWLIDASVSFTKGCFVGQELVARIDSRGGNVPRVLHGLVVDAADAVLDDAVVLANGAEVGRITSAAPWDGATVALCFVKRGTEADTVEVAAGDDRLTASLRSLPMLPPPSAG